MDNTLATFDPRAPQELLRELGESPDPSRTSCAPRVIRKQLLDDLTRDQAPHLIAAARKQRAIFDRAIEELTRRISDPDTLEGMKTTTLLKILAMADHHLTAISQALMRDGQKQPSSDAVTLAMILAMTHAIHGAPATQAPAQKDVELAG
jgi:hypothetical protein